MLVVQELQEREPSVVGELARFVRVPPDVHQADRRVEPVEHDQRQGQMVQDGPQHVPVEGVPGGKVKHV